MTPGEDPPQHRSALLNHRQRREKQRRGVARDDAADNGPAWPGGPNPGPGWGCIFFGGHLQAAGCPAFPLGTRQNKQKKCRAWCLVFYSIYTPCSLAPGWLLSAVAVGPRERSGGRGLGRRSGGQGQGQRAVWQWRRVAARSGAQQPAQSSAAQPARSAIPALRPVDMSFGVSLTRRHQPLQGMFCHSLPGC